MTESTALRYPVFIVGMPRSGTTLLSTMLDAHPQFAISPETHFYTRCRSDDSQVQDTVEDVWHRLRQQPGIQDMDLNTEEMEGMWERLNQRNSAEPADLLWALCVTYVERSSAQAWGEKTPDHLDHVPTILEEFPEAVVLGIVRDPRDICLSLRGMPWNRASLPESARKWRRYTRLIGQYKHDYPNHFRQVRYEDLLSDPKSVMRDVLEWLNASFNPAVLSFHEQESGLVDSNREPWKQKAQAPLDPKNREKWRTRMGPAEQWVVQRIVGRQLEDQGYPAPPVSWDGAFLKDLLRVLVRTGWVIGRRILRRWITPSRGLGDHRPTWVRRNEDRG